MRSRIVYPILLLLTGSGSLLYGLLFHAVTVYSEEESEVAIAYPTPFAPVATGHRPSSDGEESPLEQPSSLDRSSQKAQARPDRVTEADEVNPFETPPAQGTQRETDETSSENPFETPSEADRQIPLPSDVTIERIMEKVLVFQEEREHTIVREVTVGGIARLADGQLRRTYTGQPPSLCPS